MPEIPPEEEADIVFDGNILNSLTANLPNNMIALRELIKNAYDASADKIEIKFDKEAGTLSIEDDGNGMDRNELMNLFHIGRRNKNYGESFVSARSHEQRFIQGSKGLGFLSAMHFGNEVIWTSCKDDGIGREIRCKLSDLVANEDLSKAKLPIKKIGKRNRGTRIEVTLDSSHVNSLGKLFNNKTSVSMICNTFRDSSIEIEVESGNGYIPEKLSNVGKVKNGHLFYVKILRKSREVRIFYRNEEVSSFQIPSKQLKYDIEGELYIYVLSSGKKAKDVTDLCKNPRGSLNPLIYINHCLFADYTLFDPEIQRRSKSGVSLPQIIGYIDIICSDDELQFNQDRTQLSENDLSVDIRETLLEINKRIQKDASAYRDQNSNLTPGHPVPEVDDRTARILFKNQRSFTVPSAQIDLRKDLLQQVINSQGDAVPFNEVQVSIAGEESTNGILESQTNPDDITITYSYVDKNTGLLAQEITLRFVAAKKRTPKPDRILLPFEMLKTSNCYLNTCRILMHEINKLGSVKRGVKYNEVIACSLRCIFELAMTALSSDKQSPKEFHNFMKVHEKGKDDEYRVGFVIEHFQKNAPEYEKRFDMGYHSIMNFDPADFKQQYKSSNLGAHKGTSYLTNTKIDDIGKAASTFALFVSVILSNDKK